MEGFGGVSLADYANMAGGTQFSGNYSEAELAELYKAMEAGQITGRETTDRLDASGAPLKVESLENTLKILTNTQKHTPFFYRIGKKPATNTVEEFNQLVSYGGLEGGSLLEGELPENSDSVYRRKAVHIKYYGVVGGVTHPMQLVKTGSGVANMMAQEVKNKVALMTKILEGKLPFADSRKISTDFDGFFAQQEMGGDFTSDPAYVYEQRLLLKNIAVAVENLPARERNLILSYLGLEGTAMTFRELAVLLNYNGPSSAEKAYRRAVEKLKAALWEGEYGQYRWARRMVNIQKRNSCGR